MHERMVLCEDGEGERALDRADIHRFYWKGWRKALEAYLAHPTDPCRAFEFLALHPANQSHRLGFPESRLRETLEWQMAKVDPATRRAETKKSKRGGDREDSACNTETVVWVEWGPWQDSCGLSGAPSHDYRTDTSGHSFEEALVNLAHNVWMLYRDRTSVTPDAQLRKKDRW